MFGASVMIPVGYRTFFISLSPLISVNIFIQPVTCDYRYSMMIVQFVRFGHFFGGFPIVQEPVIGLIKWLRPKGVKVCSYVEKCAKFKNQTLKKIGLYIKILCAMEYPGVGIFSK